ncbi:hypothetical protein [Acinetobacter radioresistens]|uniref:hypothetical protein n=1 Tax=Acinetobacter radioresistens TaxID=40216 RepID=UPI0022468F11|nr:hypothetical protein [Acinetobacter radioresistens]MCX0338310.1 hypothetical protein [Acinetobacter radioresistens]
MKTLNKTELLQAFRIWIEKLQAKIIPMQNTGFYFVVDGRKGFVTDENVLSNKAKKLMKEFIGFLRQLGYRLPNEGYLSHLIRK